MATPDVAAGVTGMLLDRLGFGADDGARLLDVSPEALVQAQAELVPASESLSVERRRRGLGLPFQPVIDGDVLPARAVDAVADGAATGVSLIAGTTLDEWNLFTLMTQERDLDNETLRRRVGKVFDDERADDVIDVYERSRPGASPAELWNAVMTDLVFRLPAIRLLEAHAPHGPAWSYLFTWPSSAFEGRLGACHAVEIPFVFDNLGRKGVPFFLGDLDDRAHALANATSRAWLAFASTGDPNHDGLPHWPRYDTARRATMELGTTQAVLDDPAGEVREVWAGAI
jgi:para-nitrobenzyl esterase